MNQTLVVAAAIVDDLHQPNRLCAARRVRPPALAGMWEFPGGKVSPGESPLDALHRELLEELGVTTRIGVEITPPNPSGWPIAPGFVLRLWLAQIIDGIPQPLVEHDQITWLERGQWHSIPWLSADIPIVDSLVAQIFPDLPE